MTALRRRLLVGTRNPVLSARPAGSLLAEVVTSQTSALPGAACVGVAPDLFFPEDGDAFAERRAKEICGDCPVRARCLELALERREHHGIFGGLDTEQRRQLLYGGAWRERIAQVCAEGGDAA